MALVAGKNSSNPNDLEAAYVTSNALHVHERYKTYPGVYNNRRLTDLTSSGGRVTASWTREIVAVRLRAFGTNGDRIKVIFDAPNDALADAWMADVSGGGNTVMYHEIVVGDDWREFEFADPGILRIDVLNTVDPTPGDELWIEAVEAL